MEFTKKDLVYLLGFCIMFYYLKSKTEKLANTDIDVEAIRNLSDYANQLTKDGKLVVPGGLEIQGKLKMKGLELYPDADNRLVIKNSNGHGVLGSRNKYYFHITSDKEVYFDKQLNIPNGINMDKKLSLTKNHNNCLVIKNSNGQAELGSRDKNTFNIESSKSFKFNNNITSARKITGQYLESAMKITGKNLEIKQDSYFGTVGHKLGIIHAGGNHGTYFQFYQKHPAKKTFYLLPYINGVLYNNSHFKSEGYVNAVGGLAGPVKVNNGGLIVKEGSIFAKSHIGTRGRFYTWKNDGIQRGCDYVYENGSGKNCKSVS